MMKNHGQAAIQPMQTIHFGNRLAAYIACILALGILVVAAPVQAATNRFWNTATGSFGTAANWDVNTVPAAGDQAIFTNPASYTVSFASSFTSEDRGVFSGQTAVVTLDMGTRTWGVTNGFRIGYGTDGTATVYIAAGTLDGSFIGLGQGTRIGDAGNGTESAAGALFVTNGTFVSDQINIGVSSNAIGKLVVTGPGVITNTADNSGSLVVASGSDLQNNQVFITNGGKVFMEGEVRVGATGATNNFLLVSGPGSILSAHGPPGGIRIGAGLSAGNLLIVSNGAKMFSSNGGSIGANGSVQPGNWNTGIVVGAGSAWLPQAGGSTGNVNIAIGTNTGSSGGPSNNTLIVYDGGVVTVGGTIQLGNGGPASYDNTFHLGGTGLMSTGNASRLRFPNFSNRSVVTITNAYFATGFLDMGNGGTNTLSVLAGGRYVLEPGIDTNALDMTGGVGNSLQINGGTVDASAGGDLYHFVLTGSNNTFSVTGGGKLMTDTTTIGGGSAFSTGTVSGVSLDGVSSVWSNIGSVLILGTGAGGSSNEISVTSGGSLYNAGTISIGASPTSTLNSVIIGGIGSAISTGKFDGPVRVGSSSLSDHNRLIVTNGVLLSSGTIVVGADAGTINGSGVNNTFELRSGTVNANFVQVRGTNTMLYSSGAFTFTTLRVDGNLLGTAPLTVGSSASLSGVGSVQNPVTVDGAISPGDAAASPATLTISNNLVLNSTAALNYDLGTVANADKVVVIGNLTLDGTLNVTDAGSFGVGNYTIMTYTGSLVNNTLNQGTMPGGFSYAIVAGSGTVVLQVTAAVAGYSAFESFYGLTPGTGNADADSDGLSNTNEFLAGFNPSNHNAYVHITNVARSAGTNVVVTYLGANGDSSYSGGPGSRTNVLEFTTGTGNGSYTNNFLPIGAGGTNILSLRNWLGHGYQLCGYQRDERRDQVLPSPCAGSVRFGEFGRGWLDAARDRMSAARFVKRDSASSCE